MGMKIKISTESEPKFLHVIATGEFSLEEAKRTFLEMLEAVAANHSTRILFDGRELTGEPTTMERFYYGVFTAEETSRHVYNVPRFAYVLKEPVLDPRKFGENTAVNRGVTVTTFTSFDAALNWLLST
jgi:hypothetical protein